jgi:hypothetical protein
MQDYQIRSNSNINYEYSHKRRVFTKFSCNLMNKVIKTTLDFILIWTSRSIKLELWVTSLSDTPHLQYYDVQTLEYRYNSKLPMKNEWIWSYVKETTSHLQNKQTKNIHLGVATRSSTKWDCLKPIWFHQYTWGLQHFLTFLQEDIGHIKCYWFKIIIYSWVVFILGNFAISTFTYNIKVRKETTS